MTGQRGIDIAYSVDILQRAHSLMRELGLDPSDSTEAEVDRALKASSNNESLFRNMEDVGLIFGLDRIVSFNLIDIRNSLEKQPLEQDSSMMRQKIFENLIDRYYRAYGDEARLDKTVTLIRQTITGLDDTKENIKLERGEDMSKILCIGDIFTDAFITLGDDTAKIFKEGDMEWLAVPFGRKPPYEKVEIVRSVGPSPNVAVSLSRLGLESSLMAWVGGDDTGKEAIDYLKSENVSTEPMIIEADKATSYWYVLVYKADRTMLVKSEKYRYEWRDPATKPSWIYLAYLGEDSWDLHQSILDYLQRNPDVKFAFQPGTFQFEWGTDRMKDFYARSDIVLMNREEAMDVTGLPYDSVRDLADGLHKLGAGIVVITDGPNGSYAFADGRLMTVPNYPDPKPPLERTGAGDAFSSTFVGAIAEGESVETALLWSPINSMNVVQHTGAQQGLLTRDELNRYLAEAPEWYKVSEIEG